ncbi:DNA/RNA helicase domain-containing protein [Luteibaculum oceani]|uniref:DUF2075 domain-containing protein n=1 Tax=Luteibaculum oceani TaxID=1294296 RepID=A0A5C6VJP0_9FLAO|nr:DNA/RNA helicase domain-containing protein [Luteibaculum oceani]TXC85170.1 DUF2075 domain-containing protein [Luteibaculum oceani]
MSAAEVRIDQYDFDQSLFQDFNSNRFAKDLWPLVYILSDGNTKTAYVGETTDAFNRMSAHLKHNAKSKLTSVHLITSDKFNKSATLDIESNLIKYMSGDNKYTLLNGNLGLANHNYYQKQEVYWAVFNAIWNQLRSKGIADHSIDHIDNSDLFKYSPYKSLTKEQSEGLFKILESIATGKFKNIVVEGGAGTGKTILAIFLFKMLSTDLMDFNFREFGSEEQKFIELINQIRNKFSKPKMALVVPMSSFRSTLKKVFKNIKGLSASMVIGPAEVSKNQYDFLVVDESHRLRRRVNLGAYFGAFDKACAALKLDKHTCSELDWVTMQAKHTILFYDEGQSIKPSDARKEDFDTLKAAKNTCIQRLKSQFRVRGGNAYVQYISTLLNGKLDSSTKAINKTDYEFLLFDSLGEMVKQIKKKDQEYGLSRLIAGYSWEWKSNKNSNLYDIEEDGVKLRWNGTPTDWINSKNSVDEVGCIHTTQGYDLNYSGVIFGHEISYDPKKQEIIIKEENYYDKNGKQSVRSPEELKSFILNIYRTILLRGIRGTYVYVCDPELRKYLSQHIPKFSIAPENPSIPIKSEPLIPYENAVPLFDLKAAAGAFSEEQLVEEENLEWIKVPNHLKASKDLFACRVVGESMNKVIKDGQICIFRKYSGGSRQGKIVLVESTSIQDQDSGSCYTVKEYHSKKTEAEGGWRHASIILKPHSKNPFYQEIELGPAELNDFKVLGIFECALENDVH